MVNWLGANLRRFESTWLGQIFLAAIECVSEMLKFWVSVCGIILLLHLCQKVQQQAWTGKGMKEEPAIDVGLPIHLPGGRSMGHLLALYQDCAALARFFGSSSTKGQHNFLPLINGDEEWVPQRKMNLTVKGQKNLPLKLTDNVLQSASYSFGDLTDRVLQHEWVWSALFMLCKHQNEFLEGGDYEKIRNVTLRATNRSGKWIFALLNRLLCSHSNIWEHH